MHNALVPTPKGFQHLGLQNLYQNKWNWSKLWIVDSNCHIFSRNFSILNAKDFLGGTVKTLLFILYTVSNSQWEKGQIEGRRS